MKEYWKAPAEPGYYASAGTLADNAFRAKKWQAHILDQACTELWKIFGITDVDDMWFDHIIFDDYDDSIMLTSCKDGIEPTPEHVKAIKALGFSKVIFDYQNDRRKRF